MTTENAPLTVYVSRFCPHSQIVRRFIEKNSVPAVIINIDDDPTARETVIGLNNGYASVPTLVFADGSTLTEPSLRQLKAKLGLGSPSLIERLRSLFS